MNDVIKFPTATTTRPKQPDHRERAALLAGLARLGSDVLGEKATEAAATLLRQAGELKRSA